MSVDYCVQSLACTPDAKNHIDSIIRPAAIKPFDWVQGIQLSAFWQPWQQFQLALLSSTVAPKPTLLCELASVETLSINHRKRVLYSPEGGKKSKSRKLDQDTVTASPVSGMFIKEESALPPPDKLQKEADELDETAAFVEVSEESRRQIDSIKNVIGECICKLCKVRYDDVFKLAQHRCPRIAHEEYNCPECDKSFSCPANLASHRRWHRPREAEPQSCPSCTAVLTNKRQLRAHLTVCQPTLEVLLGQLSPPCSL